MIRLHKKTNGSIIATKRVERKTVSRWGILSIKNKKKKYFQIKDVIEKPSIKKYLLFIYFWHLKTASPVPFGLF